uniref:Immunoglobulin domain-containing protein n=1 Tax=Spermophilus dauricus TaxID=99837 RepID=A0A8C9Q4R0_SPEDA
MRSTLPVLLCLGQSSGFLAGTLPKPNLWAEPGPVIPRERSVTLWCQGSLYAQEYCLLMERTRRPTCRRALQGPGNRAMFPIPTMTAQDAGGYQCYYQSPAGSSQHSERLELVVTGERTLRGPAPAVTLWAETQGSSSSRGVQEALLSDHHCPRPAQQPQDGLSQADFLLGPVSSSHGGRYRCYGGHSLSSEWSAPSHPLNIVVTCEDPRGALRDPASAQPCWGAPGGDGQGEVGSQEGETGRGREDRDRGTQGQEESETMRQTESTGSSERGPGEVSAQNKLGPPSPSFLSPGQLPVTPSLSVQPGPTVSSGENVTLLCQSQIKMDTFLLCKEGAADPPLRLRAEYRAPWYQAEFSMRAVTPALGGTYRCYGSHSSSPYLLSWPSAPLDLVVSGEAIGGSGSFPPAQGCPGLGRSLKILVGVSVPLLLLPLFLLLGYQCRGQCRKAGEWGGETWWRPRGISKLCSGHTGWEALVVTLTRAHQSGLRSCLPLSPPQSPADEDLWAVTYAEVSHSRVGRGRLSTSPPESRTFLVIKDTSEGEDSLQGCQVAASGVPQGVTYAQLKDLKLMQGTDLKLRQETATPPSSQEGKSPALHSDYATLAFH